MWALVAFLVRRHSLTRQILHMIHKDGLYVHTIPVIRLCTGQPTNVAT